MLLIAEVTDLQSAAEDKIAVTFRLTGTNPDLDMKGSQMALLFPRVLGKRWSIGQHTRVQFEDITNGQEQTLSVVQSA